MQLLFEAEIQHTQEDSAFFANQADVIRIVHLLFPDPAEALKGQLLSFQFTDKTIYLMAVFVGCETVCYRKHLLDSLLYYTIAMLQCQYCKTNTAHLS